jgi:hypothetical protein
MIARMNDTIADRPMTRRLLRWLGWVMRVLGVAGITVSIVLALALPFIPSRSIPTVQDALASTAEGLRGVSNSMEHASAGMLSAAELLGSAGHSVLDIAESVQTTKPLIESAAGLIETVGETTLEETNQALASAHDAAQAVDQVLRSLSVLSAVTGITYDPERSLDHSIQDIADGLQPLPQGLIDVSQRLYDTAEGFDEVSTSLDQTGDDLRRLSTELSELGRDLGELSVSLNDHADGLDRLGERVPLMIWLLVGMLEVLLIGVSLAQVTVIKAGRQLVLENPT